MIELFEKLIANTFIRALLYHGFIVIVIVLSAQGLKWRFPKIKKQTIKIAVLFTAVAAAILWYTVNNIFRWRDIPSIILIAFIYDSLAISLYQKWKIIIGFLKEALKLIKSIGFKKDD